MSTITTWLQERTALSLLSSETLEAIIPLLEEKSVPEQTELVKQNTAPDGLYILRSGDIINQQDLRIIPTGSLINLKSIVLNQPTEEVLLTQSQCEFWYISQDSCRELLALYPEITQIFSEQLAKQLDQLTAQLNFEQERQIVLRPYLVPKVKRGIIGKTRYAVKLRSQIKEAAKNRHSVLIFGEPGLEKDNIAGLIHFSSAYRREPLVKIDCATLQSSGADLWGRAGGKLGLIEAVGNGTLVLNNLHELPSELYSKIGQLLQTRTYIPVSRSGESLAKEKVSKARIIMISERMSSQEDFLVEFLIKVPPLRVRKADIDDYVNYYISLICRAKGISQPHLTPEAIRKLQAYDFPNNLRELETLISRAMTQLDNSQTITEEIIWPSQGKKKQFRFNLLNPYPKLRQFLRSSWYPDKINYGFVAPIFALVVIILFIAPQTRSENFALNLFWAWWWPLILIIFPFLGRIWCAFCPFMIYGEITQKLSLWLFPRQLKKWPRESAQQWGGWFLFGLFALILLWEELWNLQNTAYLSACLLLLITAGAMIFSAIFERRFWCRYLCPIGGMNGMFAKLSMTELRAQQGTCSAECTTYQCYKGGPQKGEGMETNGCPLYSHPAQLEDNRDCVLCMTCLKACPHRSVEFNLRLPGIELWTSHLPRWDEVALLFLLLNVVFLHRLPELLEQGNWQLNLHQFNTHSMIAIALLTLPTLFPLLSYGLIHQLFHYFSSLKPRSFVELAYGYLPLVLAGNLAHYLRLGLGEAGRIIPVTLATFGLSGEGMPILVAHPAVIAFLQGVTLIIGVFCSIILTQKIAKQPFKFLLPQHLCLVGITVMFWRLIVGY